MTGYVVHYSDGVTDMHMNSVVATSLLITNLTCCNNYTYSVEATSQHFSGLSRIFIMTLGIFSIGVWYPVGYIRVLIFSS